jgi:hypothetical protein
MSEREIDFAEVHKMFDGKMIGCMGSKCSKSCCEKGKTTELITVPHSTKLQQGEADFLRRNCHSEILDQIEIKRIEVGNTGQFIDVVLGCSKIVRGGIKKLFRKTKVCVFEPVKELYLPISCKTFPFRFDDVAYNGDCPHADKIARNPTTVDKVLEIWKAFGAIKDEKAWREMLELRLELGDHMIFIDRESITNSLPKNADS